jgi:hypothetical protein
VSTPKPQWRTPALVVLVRSQSGEAVLVVCKLAGQSPLSQVVDQTTCTFDSVVTGHCSACDATFAS